MGHVKRVTISFAELDRAAERLAAMGQAIVWAKAVKTFKMEYHRKVLELFALTGLEITVGEPPTLFKEIDQKTGKVIPDHLVRVDDAIRRIRG